MLGNRQPHTHSILCVVLKEGTAYGRSSSLTIGGIGEGGEAGSPHLGTAGSSRYIHVVSEQLGNQLCVRSFAAAGACAREFQQRLLKLAALYGIHAQRILLL